MTASGSAPPPIVCTLTTKELARRAITWGDLAPLALNARRVEGGVVSTYPLELADQIEDLAGREIDCCGSWLDISTARSDEALTLHLTTSNPEGLELIMAMVPAADD